MNNKFKTYLDTDEIRIACTVTNVFGFGVHKAAVNIHRALRSLNFKGKISFIYHDDFYEGLRTLYQLDGTFTLEKPFWLSDKTQLISTSYFEHNKDEFDLVEIALTEQQQNNYKPCDYLKANNIIDIDINLLNEKIKITTPDGEHIFESKQFSFITPKADKNLAIANLQHLDKSIKKNIDYLLNRNSSQTKAMAVYGLHHHFQFDIAWVIEGLATAIRNTTKTLYPTQKTFLYLLNEFTEQQHNIIDKLANNEILKFVDITAKNFQTEIEASTDAQVIIIKIGKLPYPIFDYLVTEGTEFPFLHEGLSAQITCVNNAKIPLLLDEQGKLELKQEHALETTKISKILTNAPLTKDYFVTLAKAIRKRPINEKAAIKTIETYLIDSQDPKSHLSQFWQAFFKFYTLDEHNVFYQALDLISEINIHKQQISISEYEMLKALIKHNNLSTFMEKIKTINPWISPNAITPSIAEYLYQQSVIKNNIEYLKACAIAYPDSKKNFVYLAEKKYKVMHEPLELNQAIHAYYIRPQEALILLDKIKHAIFFHDEEKIAQWIERFVIEEMNLKPEQTINLINYIIISDKPEILKLFLNKLNLISGVDKIISKNLWFSLSNIGSPACTVAFFQGVEALDDEKVFHLGKKPTSLKEKLKKMALGDFAQLKLERQKIFLDVYHYDTELFEQYQRMLSKLPFEERLFALSRMTCVYPVAQQAMLVNRINELVPQDTFSILAKHPVYIDHFNKHRNFSKFIKKHFDHTSLSLPISYHQTNTIESSIEKNTALEKLCMAEIKPNLSADSIFLGYPDNNALAVRHSFTTTPHFLNNQLPKGTKGLLALSGLFPLTIQTQADTVEKLNIVSELSTEDVPLWLLFGLASCSIIIAYICFNAISNYMSPASSSKKYR